MEMGKTAPTSSIHLETPLGHPRSCLTTCGDMGGNHTLTDGRFALFVTK